MKEDQMKHEWYAWGGFIIAAGMAVAIAIIPSMCRHVDGISATDHLLTSVVVASRQYRTEFGNWPSSLNDLTNNAKRVIFIDWGKRGPVDPWGQRLVYMPFNQKEGCGLVISWGADGKPGGTRQDRDRIAEIK